MYNRANLRESRSRGCGRGGVKRNSSVSNVMYECFSVLFLLLQASVTPVPRNQVARSASVS